MSNIQLSPKLTKSDIDNLKKGQCKMTDILRWFDKICRENNLKYWVVGGTLIGTLRHKGWIPWDGDLDVNMMHKDLDKFINIIKDQVPKNLVVILPKDYNTPHCKTVHSKIKDLYSHYYDGGECEGLCLDIFPIEKIIHKQNHVYKTPKRPKTPKASTNYSFTLPTNSIIQYTETYLLKGHNDCWAPICGIPDKSTRKYCDVFPLKELYFEDIKVYVPNKYKEVSKQLWGDYPPPIPHISRRYPHEGKINPNKPTKKMLDKYKARYEGKNQFYPRIIPDK